MDDTDFEGTLVLEPLAAIGKIDEFFDATPTRTDRRTAGSRSWRCNLRRAARRARRPTEHRGR
jgi:hypothetical protein